MSFFVLIIILFVCLVLEGFFSGSEMALVNADKYRLALATDAGSKQALSALHMVKHPAKFFSTTLLGTNLCTVTGSVVSTLYIIDNFGPAYAPFAIIYWPFTLVLGEIVPKSLYQHYADKLVLYVSPILLGISVALHPVIWSLSKITDSLLGRIKRKESTDPPIQREELEVMLEVGGDESSDVRVSERTMISRIFDLADKRVKNIMTPLIDIIALPITSSRDDALAVMEKHIFSRVPIYDGRVLNIVGVLDGADLFFGDDKAAVTALKKPAYYVPEEMPLDELLVAMKRRGEQLAVAVDEYGAATGIVTVEDLLEEVVGEIRDEHDEAPALFRRLGWKHYIVSGRMEIEFANERLNLNLPEGDYETVAGFVIHKFERIPKIGETFTFGNYKFTVSRATDRVILDVEVAHIPAPDLEAQSLNKHGDLS